MGRGGWRGWLAAARCSRSACRSSLQLLELVDIAFQLRFALVVFARLAVLRDAFFSLGARLATCQDQVVAAGLAGLGILYVGLYGAAVAAASRRRCRAGPER